VKTMWPLGGQSSPTSSPPATSAGILLTVISLWTDYIWVWKRFAVLNIRFAVLWTWRICCINRASATESISLLYEMQKANEIVTTADFKMTVSKLLRASTLYLIWDMRISRWQSSKTFRLKVSSLPKARIIELPTYVILARLTIGALVAIFSF
jgi:hypothetical protein